MTKDLLLFSWRQSNYTTAHILCCLYRACHLQPIVYFILAIMIHKNNNLPYILCLMLSKAHFLFWILPLPFFIESCVLRAYILNFLQHATFCLFFFILRPKHQLSGKYHRMWANHLHVEVELGFDVELQC